jgi:hypothetical protein
LTRPWRMVGYFRQAFGKNHVWCCFVRLAYFLISCFDLNLTAKACLKDAAWGAKFDGFFKYFKSLALSPEGMKVILESYLPPNAQCFGTGFALREPLGSTSSISSLKEGCSRWQLSSICTIHGK